MQSLIRSQSFLLLLGLSPWLAAPGSAAGAAQRAAVKIVLVGDSTVTDNAGWGLGFRQFLADGVTLVNTARGGRSSRTFREEGRWDEALALGGDYYLIQFGHNDQPGKPERSTTLEEFRDHMTRYVVETRAAGATPVLVTPLVRREFRNRDHPDRIVSSLAPWADAVREIALEENVAFIDLHDRSKALCERMGRDGVRRVSPIKPNGRYDGTHLNSAGYVPFGRIVAEGLKQAVPGMEGVILRQPRDPTPASGAVDFDAVVSRDGAGTHTTIQAAVDDAPDAAAPDQQFRVLVRPGVYREHLVIPAGKRFIQLMGEPGQEHTTVVSQGTHVKTPDPQNSGGLLSTADSSTSLISGSDITVRYLTFENTTTREDRVQALACYVTGDRVAFHDCRFLGWQDTLRSDAAGRGARRHYFRGCYIEGHVDYIYAGGTAVFDRCRIHTKADGYITAASTAQGTPYGYVFLDCDLTTGPAVERGVYLGRPWRPYAATAFIRCAMDSGIRPEGWHNWGNAENEHTARYVEYGSTGPGANPDQRVAWARRLDDAEAKAYTVRHVLGGDDNWRPDR